jgi:hypothetical protein
MQRINPVLIAIGTICRQEVRECRVGCIVRAQARGGESRNMFVLIPNRLARLQLPTLD